MEDSEMKKTYITPEMETYRLQTQGMLLDTSSLDPKDYGGGGVGGSRIFEDDELDMLLGDTPMLL